MATCAPQFVEDKGTSTANVDGDEDGPHQAGNSGRSACPTSGLPASRVSGPIGAPDLEGREVGDDESETSLKHNPLRLLQLNSTSWGPLLQSSPSLKEDHLLFLQEHRARGVQLDNLKVTFQQAGWQGGCA